MPEPIASLELQCVLAGLVAVRLAFLPRPAQSAAFQRSWTWAWTAHALALAALLARELVPLAEEAEAGALDGMLVVLLCDALHQVARFAGAWWMLEGALLLTGRRARPLGGGGMQVLLAACALLTVLLASTPADLLALQTPLVALTSVGAAWVLLRQPSGRASSGARLLGAALLAHGALRAALLVALAQPSFAAAPLERTAWTFLVTHHGWLELPLDVLVATGMLVLLRRSPGLRALDAGASRVALEPGPEPRAELAPQELPPREIPRRAPAAAGRGAKLRLLAIEDEPMLCEMLRSVGRQHGWEVETAGTGDDGLRLLRGPGRPYDVVLCDLHMASPSGIEIHDELARERPALLERFLFVTGDLSSDDAAEFARRCSRPILRKPFQIVELVRLVEDAAAAAVPPA